MRTFALQDFRVLGTAPLGAALMLMAAMSNAAGIVFLKYFRWTISTFNLTGWQLLLGGIPVVRSSSNNFVDQIVERFNNSEALVIAIAPEGTRYSAPYWRTGFYYMALGAGIPIAFGFVDYDRKTLGIYPGIHPSGDLPADMELIRQFYMNTVQFYQEGKREIQLKDL